MLKSNTLTLNLPTPAATRRLGSDLWQHSSQQGTIYLQGELGTGKTTLVRGLLLAAKYQGAVKSPTYTLVEPYSLADKWLYHFDLYRLSDPEELEYLGIRDYFTHDTLCLIEWPERGAGILPAADLLIQLDYQPAGRRARLTGLTDTGRQVICALSSSVS
jgi:tRNA threonylcarbamoyladenosine biosynthesis protein TsaE